MNSIYKYFLLFCFAVFFLGCRSGKQDTVGVSAGKGGEAKTAAQQNNQKPDTETVDISQMPAEKKAVYITQAEQIKTLNVGLKTAQRLFDQVWVCLWYAKKNADNTLGECPSVSQLQTVENVFHYSQNVISNIYASNGLPFISTVNKDDCSKKNYRDVLGVSGINEYVLRRRQCVGDNKSSLLKNPGKMQPTQAGKQVAEQTNANSNNGNNREIDKKEDRTSGPTQGGGDNVVSADLFKWSVKPNNEFELTFYVENMQEAAGLNLSFSRKNTVCSFKFKDAKTLLSLNCKNVGQNKNGNEFLLLENFVYNQQQEIAVQLDGQISSWDGQDYKTDVIRSMTVPVQGEALLDIERAPVESSDNSTPLQNDLNNKGDQKDQSHQDGQIDPNNPKNPKVQGNQNDQSQKDQNNQNEQNNKTEEKTDPRSGVNPNETARQGDSSAAESSEQSADSLKGRSTNPTTDTQNQGHETTDNSEQPPADQESQAQVFQQSVT